MSTKVNLKITQGSTYSASIRWESAEKVYKAISSINKSAPIEINTTEAHEIPNGWRVKLSNIVGMKELNTGECFIVDKVLPGSFQINSINALNYSSYSGGGVVEYNKPVPLAGVTGRMQIRPKVTSDVVLLELNTDNGGIVVDDTNSIIHINITAEETALLDFSTAMYSLELVNAAAEVTQLISGSITLLKEVTR